MAKNDEEPHATEAAQEALDRLHQEMRADLEEARDTLAQLAQEMDLAMKSMNPIGENHSSPSNPGLSKKSEQRLQNLLKQARDLQLSWNAPGASKE